MEKLPQSPLPKPESPNAKMTPREEMEEHVRTYSGKNFPPKLLIEPLRKGDVRQAIVIKDIYKVPDTILQSPEIQAHVEGVIRSSISLGRISNAIKMKKAFPLSEDRLRGMQEAAEIRILLILRVPADAELITQAIEIKNEFIYTNDGSRWRQIQTAAKQVMADLQQKGVSNLAITVKREFYLSD